VINEQNTAEPAAAADRGRIPAFPGILSRQRPRPLSYVVRYHVVGEVSEVVQVSVRKDILNLITETEP